MGKSDAVVKLNKLCHKFRIDLIEMLYKAQSGHAGGSLSACEILTTLYQKILNIDPQDPRWEDRDRIVLSKGHCAPMAYLNMAELGYFPKKELNHLRKAGHLLQGHLHYSRVPGADFTGGPLGLGFSFASGIAMSAKLEDKAYKTYVLLGDGELQEGIIWETFLSVAKYNLNNLIMIVDHNGVQLDGKITDIMPMGELDAKFKAFGCDVIHVNGHNCEEIEAAIQKAENAEIPTVILAKTVKGKGVSFMEHNHFWHGAPIDKNSYEIAMLELKERSYGE